MTETSESYILWNPESDRPPTVQFPTYDEALRVADRMAQRFGSTFHVCKLICAVSPVTEVAE